MPLREESWMNAEKLAEFCALFDDDDIYPFRILQSWARFQGRNPILARSDSQRVQPWLDAFNAHFFDRRLFVTEGGYLGIGPWTLREGDAVSIIPGSYVPYLLRSGDKSGTFSIIGEAYIHGIMHGEALKHRDINSAYLYIV
jgi:hypothetical protein